MNECDLSARMKPASVSLSTSAGIVALTMLVAALAFGSQRAEATQALSQQTGKACGACHVSPGGGGKLTAQGKSFKAKQK